MIIDQLIDDMSPGKTIKGIWHIDKRAYNSHKMY